MSPRRPGTPVTVAIRVELADRPEVIPAMTQRVAAAGGTLRTIATVRRIPGDPPLVEPLNIREPIPAVIGMTGYEGLTAKTVGRVREAWQQDKKL